jgi:hypothetical protein
MRRDLVESEALVVVGSDPFRSVDRTFFERRIDVATGDLLRYCAELLQNASREAADTEF